MIYTVLMLIVGFVFLIFGGEFLVDGSSALAKRFRISQLVIGLTIVAFGTSAPELIVSILANLNDSSGIAIGNIVGSNISNIFLILGVSAIIYPLCVGSNTIQKEIPFNLLSCTVLLIICNDVLLNQDSQNFLQRTDGLVLLCFFCIFIFYTITLAKQNHDLDSLSEEFEIQNLPMWKSLVYILIGLIGLGVGGDWIVTSASAIAKAFGMSEVVIGLTIVAIGTSLPELAASAIAAKKQNSDMAIGNVIGSNLFNVLWVLGLSSSLQAIPIHQNANRDLGLLFVSNIILFGVFFIGKKHKLERWQGVLFVLIYIFYTVSLIVG